MATCSISKKLIRALFVGAAQDPTAAEGEVAAKQGGRSEKKTYAPGGRLPGFDIQRELRIRQNSEKHGKMVKKGSSELDHAVRSIRGGQRAKVQVRERESEKERERERNIENGRQTEIDGARSIKLC